MDGFASVGSGDMQERELMLRNRSSCKCLSNFRGTSLQRDCNAGVRRSVSRGLLLLASMLPCL